MNILVLRRMTMGLRWPTLWVLHEEQQTVERWAVGNGNRGWCPFSSVAQLCMTLCDPMDCSMPGFPVHHHSQSLLKLMSISGKTLNIMLMSPDFWMGWANLCCRDRDMYGVKSQYGVMKLGTVQTGILWRPMVGNGYNKKRDRKMKISQRKNKKNLEI